MRTYFTNRFVKIASFSDYFLYGNFTLNPSVMFEIYFFIQGHIQSLSRKLDINCIPKVDLYEF